MPWLVLVPAAGTLVAAAAAPRQWALLGVGAVAYASGHGIHLAANSVGNADPGPTAHLWDEAVGHALWYAGVALTAAAVATTLSGRPRPRGRALVVGVVLAVAAGTTWATNAWGAEGLVLPALLPALVAGWGGWRGRRGLGVLLLPTSFAAVAVLLLGAVLGRASAG